MSLSYAYYLLYHSLLLQNVGPLPGYIEDAVKSAYKRYMKYLESFGPEENYLRKKVENELGTKMIHLKMRCSGVGSEWGKVHSYVTYPCCIFYLCDSFCGRFAFDKSMDCGS